MVVISRTLATRQVTASLPPAAPARAREAPSAEPKTIIGGPNHTKVVESVFIAILFFIPALVALIASLPIALIAGAITAPQKDGNDGSGTFLFGFAETLRWLQRNVFFLLHTPMQAAVTRIGQSFVISPFLYRRTPEGRELTVRIFLEGAASDVALPRRYARQISDKLTIPGTTVHVEFVDQPGENTMTIPVHRGGVSYAMSWRADDDAETFAHELMHRLGCMDEYSHSRHFTNAAAPAGFKFTRIFERLYQDDIPADAGAGIMANSSRPPLPRHYDEILAKAGITQ